MADIAGLAKLFEKAEQITLGLTIDGKGAVVTLTAAEMRLVAGACKAAAQPIGKPAYASPGAER